MRRIIFLDFDGVLNSHPGKLTVRETPEGLALCPENIACLNHLIENTGAEVVVSSQWREGREPQELQDILDRCGFQGTIAGKTPDLTQKTPGGLLLARPRGDEIQAWLDIAGEVSFVILDDEGGMGLLKPYQVRTNMYDGGLQEEHVREAEWILLWGPQKK